MRTQDVRMCAQHGADIIGFVVDFPHSVPWNISIELAKKLISEIPKPSKSCVVTGGPIDKILHIAMETRPNYIQLHYTETYEDTILLVHKLERYGIKVIKTIFPDTPDIENKAAAFCAAGVYAILFDQRTPNNAIDSGMADLHTFTKLKNAVNCPVILAGGITPANVAEIVLNTKTQAIDLMTGVECSYGIKDEIKIISLFNALQDIHVITA